MSIDAADLLMPADPLLAGGPPERVNYATGVLLQAEDFRDEQTYHRARLATALAHILGHGTLAGLAVRTPKAGDNDLHLTVEAGLAIDRHGRLIEVTEPWCIRLSRWFAAQETGALRPAVSWDEDAVPPVAVTADLFVSLADCGRGKTPSFADGPFDALDALVPARLAEQPDFELVLRAENPREDVPVPDNGWPDAGSTRDQKLAAVLGSYRPGRAAGASGELAGFIEHVGGRDPAAVLLARILIPVTLAKDAPTGTRPVLDLGTRVQVDNRLRPFIHLPGKWLGVEPQAVPLNEP